MTIRHNILPYIIPGLIAILFLVGGIENWGDAAATLMVVIGIVIFLLCWGDNIGNTLSYENGHLNDRSGFTQITSPGNKIQYVEYTGFGPFNKIRINCITGHYEFKYMVNAKRFVDYVNGQTGN